MSVVPCTDCEDIDAVKAQEGASDKWKSRSNVSSVAMQAWNTIRASFAPFLLTRGGSGTASPPRAGEQWKIVAEWDAAHQVPLTGDKRKVNPPALVAWSPKGNRLFTSCDAFGLTAWDASALGWDSKARKLGAAVNPAAYGYHRLFVTQRGNSVHVLQETESYQHAYYDIRDGEARLVCKGKNERFWGWGRGWGHSTYLDRNEGIDPPSEVWRTDSRGGMRGTLKELDS